MGQGSKIMAMILGQGGQIMGQEGKIDARWNNGRLLSYECSCK